MADYFVYFIEKGIEVLKNNGLFGIIVSNKWLRAGYGKPLRSWMKALHIEEIIDFGDLPVFQYATTYPCILRISKHPPKNEFSVTNVESLTYLDLDSYVLEKSFLVEQAGLDVDVAWSLVSKRTKLLVEKIGQISIPLGDYVDGGIFYGIKTGFNKAFVIDAERRENLINEDSKNAEIIKPFLTGRDVKRYAVAPEGTFVIFTRRGIDISKFPSIERYLSIFKDQLMPKPKSWTSRAWPGRKPGDYQWYEIQDPISYFEKFEEPKIIVPAIVQKASYMFDKDGFYSNDKTTIIPTTDLYLLGILNSRVPDFIMHQISSTKRGGYFEYKPVYIKQLPIRPINFSNPADKSRHDQIVELVKRMLDLNKQLQSAKTSHEKDSLQRQIDATDRQIDRLVYELYDLTNEEIKIVEEGAGK